jgi:hypothetical protein
VRNEIDDMDLELMVCYPRSVRATATIIPNSLEFRSPAAGVIVIDPSDGALFRHCDDAKIAAFVVFTFFDDVDFHRLNPTRSLAGPPPRDDDGPDDVRSIDATRSAFGSGLGGGRLGRGLRRYGRGWFLGLGLGLGFLGHDRTLS